MTPAISLVIPVKLTEPQPPVDTGIKTPFGEKYDYPPDVVIGNYNITIDPEDAVLTAQNLLTFLGSVDPATLATLLQPFIPVLAAFIPLVQAAIAAQANPRTQSQ